MSPSVMTTPRTTASSVPSLSTVTTGPHIPTPLTQSALSYHTAIMESEEGLLGAAADTLIPTPNVFLPQLPTPPPDRPPSFSINLPQANQSRTFLSQYREPMAIDSSTSASSGSSSNDVPRSPSPSPSSTAATYGSSPSPSLNHQVEECHIETRPTTPNLVLMRKEKFREQLEAARAHNPIIEESEEEDSTTVGSSPPQDPPQDDEDMDEGDPIDPTLSNRVPYRRIIHHRFRLPSVSTQVEALVVNEDQFIPPYAICDTDPHLPTEFYNPVLHPLNTHLQLRQHFCLILEYTSLIALDRGLNTYIEHFHASLSQHNLFHYHDCYHLRSEWMGNPFLYAIERMRLSQILQYFDDLDPDQENTIFKSLCEMINEVLHYKVNPTDWEMIARQRLAGYYGLPYTMPSLP
ncbi:hypothetical protein BDY19DRAFT_904603 [Irpex rosettiformis]|uniref:Uncharacterized protein n=1 Tax=Irpex rosettiformis TaxID=378272 RepID=A0ACB8UA32_9APHY|nr:hypothetical protein BDY19DRAFT_904603 [Irpex rosettiformis]